jgi:hypothetical protein
MLLLKNTKTAASLNCPKKGSKEKILPMTLLLCVCCNLYLFLLYSKNLIESIMLMWVQAHSLKGISPETNEHIFLVFELQQLEGQGQNVLKMDW